MPVVPAQLFTEPLSLSGECLSLEEKCYTTWKKHHIENGSVNISLTFVSFAFLIILIYYQFKNILLKTTRQNQSVKIAGLRRAVGQEWMHNKSRNMQYLGQKERPTS